MYNIVGTCSLCGGRVMVPQVYHSVVPPTPTCESCGATAATSGPVIPMVPRRPGVGQWKDPNSTDKDPNEGKPKTICHEGNYGGKRLLNG